MRGARIRTQNSRMPLCARCRQAESTTVVSDGTSNHLPPRFREQRPNPGADPGPRFREQPPNPGADPGPRPTYNPAAGHGAVPQLMAFPQQYVEPMYNVSGHGTYLHHPYVPPQFPVPQNHQPILYLPAPVSSSSCCCCGAIRNQPYSYHQNQLPANTPHMGYMHVIPQFGVHPSQNQQQPLHLPAPAAATSYYSPGSFRNQSYNWGHAMTGYHDPSIPQTAVAGGNNTNTNPRAHIRSYTPNPSSQGPPIHNAHTGGTDNDQITQVEHVNVMNQEVEDYDEVDNDQITQVKHVNGMDQEVEDYDEDLDEFLLQKLTEGSPVNVTTTLSEIKDEIHGLMQDPGRNRLINALLQACNGEHLTQLISAMVADEHKFFHVCTHISGHACVKHVVYRLMSASPEQRCLLVSVLARLAVRLMNSRTGYNVVRHCMRVMLPAVPHDRNAISRAVVDNVCDIATNPIGCECVVHWLKDAPQRHRRTMAAKIAENVIFLSKDRSGNYVVQNLLSTMCAEVIERVLEIVKGHIVSLAMDMHARYVVQKLVELPAHYSIIVKEILESPQFVECLTHFHGQYVVRTALRVSTGEIRVEMAAKIREQAVVLERYYLGRKLLKECNEVRL